MVKKAVILCGGMGTRFMPMTKAVAKEMLPIIDKPAVDYIVDELIESGITEIMIVVSPGKEIIRNYYSENARLYNRLRELGKTELVESLERIDKKVKIVFAVQDIPKGSGDAVLKAEEFVDGDAFVLALGDDVMYSKDNPVSRQLIDKYNEYKKIILGVQKREVPEILRYGVIDKLRSVDKDTCEARGIMEKPKKEELTSKLAGLGRYVITPDIFETIRNTPIAKNGELQLTDSFNIMAKRGMVYAYKFKGTRYDMGDKFGSIQAAIEFGLRNDDCKKNLKEYLKERCDDKD